MISQDIDEYLKYIEGLNRDSLLDIASKLDKEKYPERWEILQKTLNSKKPELQPSSKPSFISNLWKGNIPLIKTFWLLWLLPAILFPILLNLFVFAVAPFLGVLYLVLYFVLGAAFAIYQIICIKGLWSSATRYQGKKLWSYATKGFIVIGLIFSIYSVYAEITTPREDTHDPGRTAEKLAVPTDDFPLSGFYKDKPSENFGFAIGPNEDGTYYISFCGPGGCFKPGTYLPNTTIVNDKNYEVIDNDTIKFIRTGSIVKRAPGNKR
jgi:hypothetical protein